MDRATIGALLGVVLMATTACGTPLVRNRPSGPTEGDVAELKARIVALQQEAVVGQVERDRLRQEIERLEEEQRLSAEAEVERRASAEVLGRTPSASRPPQIEETELDDSTMSPVAVAPPPPAVEPPAPSDPPPAVTTEPGTISPQAQAEYDRGYTLFHQKQYQEAEAAFDAFLRTNPNTDLSDNAQFWIGECRYARGEWRKALEAFTATVARYPQGNKVPDAMLKAGKCLEELGEPAQARDTYREIGKRFPATAAAVIARERLDALR